MSFYRIALSPFVVALLHAPLAAQCPGCAPDTQCQVSPPFPAICPQALPPATAGEAYEADITFWLPPEFQDPGSGMEVSFQQMTINNISGLPFGLAIETNSPTNTYFPQQEQFGCARICGTPLGVGTFPVTIDITAAVEVSGFPLNVPQSFQVELTVLPGAGGNNSFTFSPTTACGTAEVTFQALIDAAPQPTAWAWDFGNGQTSALAAPPPQTYNTAGTYVVTLETTVSGQVLNTVHVGTVNGDWCGDVEEPLCNCGTPFIGTCPDLYFVLTDGSGNAYTSSTVDDQTTATWNGLGLPLDNPPYSISFWDEDVVSASDHLGTYNITLMGAGTYNYNVAGGTAGHITVALETVQQFNDTDLVHVFPVPEPVITENGSTGALCVADSGLVQFLWLLDGDTVPGADGPCHTPDAAGLWQVMVTNSYGCTAISGPWTVCPTVEVTLTGNVLSVPGGFLTYAWALDGVPLADGDGPFIFTAGDGEYTVTVTAANDCVVTATYVLSSTGMGGTPHDHGRVGVHPVPNHGEFTVVAEGLAGTEALLRLTDMAGRTVWEGRAAVVNGRLRTAVLVDAAPGNYLMVVRADGPPRTVRVVVR